jgi:hypothetical protein
MAFTPEVLRRRARRAYELGRLRLAVPWAILAGTVGLLATSVTGTGAFGVCLAMFAAGMTAFSVWYGRHLGRGVWPGIWMGGLAVLLALVALTCVGRGATSFLECRLPCLVAGILIAAGALYRTRRGAAPRETLLTLVGTVAIGTPLAMIGCAGVGLGGVLALAVGLSLGSTPVIASALRASR